MIISTRTFDPHGTFKIITYMHKSSDNYLTKNVTPNSTTLGVCKKSFFKKSARPRCLPEENFIDHVILTNDSSKRPIVIRSIPSTNKSNITYNK